jgi:hypothetical protein
MISRKLAVGCAVSGALAAAAIIPGLGAGASASGPVGAHAATTYPTIDGSKDPGAAGAAINQYCNPVANCQFVGPDHPTLAYGDPRATGDAAYNCGQSYSEDSVEVSDERSESTSLDQSVSLSIKVGILKAKADTEVGELEKVSKTVGQIAAVSVAPKEKGWIDTAVPTASATGYITDGIHFEVSNFTLFYPGYKAKGSPEEVTFTGVHDAFNGNEQGVDCSKLSLSLPQPAQAQARGAGPGSAVSICSAGAGRCTAHVIASVPGIQRNTRVSLVRGGRVYASGTAGKARIVLHARRRVPRGVYFLVLGHPRQTDVLTVHVR